MKYNHFFEVIIANKKDGSFEDHLLNVLIEGQFGSLQVLKRDIVDIHIMLHQLPDVVDIGPRSSIHLVSHLLQVVVVGELDL